MKSLTTAIACLCLFTLGCKSGGDCGACDTASAESTDKAPEARAKPQWVAKPMVSDDLTNWEKLNFGGEGRIYVEKGVLNLDMGIELTGLKYTGDIKQVFGPDLENYAITLKAQRVEGTDIFLGLTFPVGNDGSVSLVLGGWGGAITGISNLDGQNASENATTKYFGFKDKRWYDVKVKVTDRIECWLDDKKIVDEPRADYTDFDTHSAVIDTRPFGLFTFGTWGAYKDLKVWTPRR